MTAAEILQEWLKFANYDPKQKQFNLLSVQYEYHKCCDTIRKFLDYDPMCEFSVLYAKKQYMEILKDTRVKVFEIIADPSVIAEEIQMWRLFTSKDVDEIEDRILGGFQSVFSNILPVKQIGQEDAEAEKKILLEAIPSVAEALHKCRVDLYMRGGHMQPISRFSPKIHVFPSLGECLLAFEAAPDGMYICYIRSNDSADGYFGFYIKSNGNLLSVNERIDEAYPGEHSHRRNHRWAEGKEFALFPYAEVINHATTDEDGNETVKRDYKGYATQYFISEEDIDIFSLGAAAYLPLLIAMVLLSNKYGDYSTADLPIIYVDSLLPINIALPVHGTKAISVPSNSLVAKAHAALTLPFEGQDIKKGTHLDLLGKKNLNKEFTEDFYGYQMDEENIFIHLYADDFQPDMTHLLESNRHVKQLTSAELAEKSVSINPEFVGTEERMTTLAYLQGRQQLADHIRERMFEEYIAFGGKPAVAKWWEATLIENKHRILEMCLQRYLKGEKYTWKEAKEDGIINWEMHLNCTSVPHFSQCAGQAYPLNKYPLYQSGYENRSKALCPITGQAASHFFLFCVDDWGDIARIAGGKEKLPKILWGYKERSHRGYTNTILNIHDPVSIVGTPFEDDEQRMNRRLWTRDDWFHYIFHNTSNPRKEVPKTAMPYSGYIRFHFAVGISKRGMAQLMKESEAKNHAD